MRWIKRVWLRGDKRRRSGYLYFPKSITIVDEHGAMYRETRWREHAAWEEEYWSDPTGSGWETIKWTDNNGT